MRYRIMELLIFRAPGRVYRFVPLAWVRWWARERVRVQLEEWGDENREPVYRSTRRLLEEWQRTRDDG